MEAKKAKTGKGPEIYRVCHINGLVEDRSMYLRRILSCCGDYSEEFIEVLLSSIKSGLLPGEALPEVQTG